MLVVHKIALDPNNKQKTFFAKSAGTARFAYNWALARWQKQYTEGGKPSEAALRRELNAVKEKDFPWMLEVGKCAPQQAIKNLGDAYNRFFKKLGGYPKFKKKGEQDSFRCDNGPSQKGTDAVQIKGKKIKVPRLGWVRMREALRFEGQIKSATISRKADRWFVSVTVDSTKIERLPSKSQGAVGVDLGCHHLATLSTGEKIEACKPYKNLLGKLKRYQRQVSRKKKGSHNRKKEIRRLQRLHARIANVRSNSLHQLTRMLSQRFNVIGIEDLNVSGMLANRRLAQSIADLGFYEFRRQLEYKASRSGGQVVVINRWFASSKLCSSCDAKNDDLRLSDRLWQCTNCHEHHDRDINAAINIKKQAVSSTVSACGEGSAGSTRKSRVKLPSTKQELSNESTIAS